jgi:hypothetical protein
MNDSLRDLRADLHRRLELLTEKFEQATGVYTERKQLFEREYRDAIALLEAERNAVEYLLTLEEKRWANVATLEALEKAITSSRSAAEGRAAPSATIRAVK